MATQQKRWLIVYDLIKDMDVNDILSYAALEHALSLPLEECRVYVYRAVRELETQNQRTMENLRNHGYRVVAANEHERLVRKDIRKIRRVNKRAQSKAVNVRRDELTPVERANIDALSLKMMQHAEMLKRLENRQDRHENALRDTRRELKETSAEVEERLALLEQQVANLRDSVS